MKEQRNTASLFHVKFIFEESILFMLNTPINLLRIFVNDGSNWDP